MTRGKQTIAVGVRFPPELLARIRREAAAFGTTVGDIVRQTMTIYYLAGLGYEPDESEAPRASK